MNPDWMPWSWAAGAVACAGLCWWVNPWRTEFAAGWGLVCKYPAAWLIPALLPGLDQWLGWALGQAPVVRPAWPAELAVPAALRESLQGWTFGYGVALLAAGLVLANAAGIRRGLIKGTESVTGRPGRWIFWPLGVGLAAILADLLLQGRGLPAAWHVGVSALAIPLLGWAAAAVLAGLLLLSETLIRAPEKVAEVRWLESAAAHSVRLWPWIPLHGLGAWLGRWLPGGWAAYTQPVLAVLAVGFCYMPLIFLHVKRSGDGREGFSQGLASWGKQAWPPLVWLAMAAMLHFAWHLAGRKALTVMEPAPWLARAAAGWIWTVLQTGLTVLTLGAWVALRLSSAPLAPRPGRTRKAKAK